MTGFRRTAAGRVVLRTDGTERGLLTMLLVQLEELVAPAPADPDADPLDRLVAIAPAARAPDDPALARLLPDAYAEDPAAAEDFRRFTERGLRQAKVDHARTARATLERSGDKVVLAEAEAQAWLLALTDMRLALGTRIGVDAGHPGPDDDDPQGGDPQGGDLPDAGPDDARAAVYGVYDWLTYLQGTLVTALMP